MLGVQKLMQHLSTFLFICPAKKDAEYGQFSKADTAIMDCWKHRVDGRCNKCIKKSLSKSFKYII